MPVGTQLPSWYGELVADLAARYAALPPGTPVRLAKRTSNLFRPRQRGGTARLDATGLDRVIAVDAAARTADVGGLTTYEDLVDATLPHGLMPLVVPELRTITLGGAVTGLGIEASSWRNGMPHESVLELDVLTGAGEVVTARPEGEHAELFHGFPNSYGTLGYALRLRIELEPVHPWVHLRHVRCGSVAEAAELFRAVCGRGPTAGVWEGEPVAFVDGVVFAPDEVVVTLGSWTDEDPPRVSRYDGEAIYYLSLREQREDWLTVRDFLWRWDTDWFWCSRAFGVQRPWVRKLLGPRWLRSDTYWRIMSVEDRWHPKERLDRLRKLPRQERVVQDVEVAVDRLAEFMAGFGANVPISPVWLCPLRQRDPSAAWPLYQFDPTELYVNIGFWSSCPLTPGMAPDHHNRWVEDEVERLGGRKSLYSTASYDRERFWSLYNGAAYDRLKHRYDPGGRLLDLYQKCVEGR